MRSLVLLALAGVAGLSALSVSPILPVRQDRAAQDGERDAFTIAVDSDLVVFNVDVTDSKGHHVTGLKAEDFQIREENQPQNIQSFSAADLPVTVGLIIDNSGSMRDKRIDVVNGALAFAHASNMEDEIFVVDFNEKTFLGLPPLVLFTNDMNAIRTALLQRAPGGLTALYDALALGLDHLKSGTRDRKVLVVLSDGGDNASKHRLDDVLDIARRSSATVYTIGIYDQSDMDRNPKVLRKIAQVTGGKAYFPQKLGDLTPVWKDIASGLRSQYSLGWHSSNPVHDGKFRSVKITASRGGKDLSVSTRDGYLVPAR